MRCSSQLMGGCDCTSSAHGTKLWWETAERGQFGETSWRVPGGRTCPRARWWALTRGSQHPPSLPSMNQAGKTPTAPTALRFTLSFPVAKDHSRSPACPWTWSNQSHAFALCIFHWQSYFFDMPEAASQRLGLPLATHPHERRRCLKNQ